MIADAFTVQNKQHSLHHHYIPSNRNKYSILDNNLELSLSCTRLDAKKKRRRKDQPQPAGPFTNNNDKDDDDDNNNNLTKDINIDDTSDNSIQNLRREKEKILSVANFEYVPSSSGSNTITTPEMMLMNNDNDDEDDDDYDDDDDDDLSFTDPTNENVIPLPDIRSVLRKKEQKELERLTAMDTPPPPKIKRSDTKAFRKLLQSNPFGDADDALFEEEEYTTVSALLGERAKPFLGIPAGPLQVGHTLGALGIVLMAFVEYPGFPLTNLPTPLRECLQQGLCTIYGINALLAIVTTFRAQERGQPLSVWIPKTLAVGGLALDQLTQLPTLAESQKRNDKKSTNKSNRRTK